MKVRPIWVQEGYPARVRRNLKPASKSLDACVGVPDFNFDHFIRVLALELFQALRASRICIEEIVLIEPAPRCERTHRGPSNEFLLGSHLIIIIEQKIEPCSILDGTPNFRPTSARKGVNIDQLEPLIANSDFIRPGIPI